MRIHITDLKYDVFSALRTCATGLPLLLPGSMEKTRNGECLIFSVFIFSRIFILI